MEERIRYIPYKGQRVLLVDVTNCSAAELIELAPLVPAHIAVEPRSSVLLLADFTGSKFDKSAFESLKQAVVLDRPHIKRSAWVGVEALPKIFYENLRHFSRRDLPVFSTREEALEYLVTEEQDKIASGQ
jgi:hypothetical protein